MGSSKDEFDEAPPKKKAKGIKDSAAAPRKGKASGFRGEDGDTPGAASSIASTPAKLGRKGPGSAASSATKRPMGTKDAAEKEHALLQLTSTQRDRKTDPLSLARAACEEARGYLSLIHI
eukprot:3810431-Pyramimonas_sp.AAC.1